MLKTPLLSKIKSQHFVYLCCASGVASGLVTGRLDAAAWALCAWVWAIGSYQKERILDKLSRELIEQEK